ncbi:hypothetical protein KIN20_035143 [Parelaphostrongylus tenuis]|uniref:JNK1/MAPK8-associated membrane protein n=1 Tax=Parelaphostrongylus tenuis TaxID=148309 RepID=A0AAD5RAP5_PARTN|nr:hypothetical protein KIN20_035143 [Parelaphostrongylus tenuis]
MVSPGPSLPPLCHGFCGRYQLYTNNTSESAWSECGPCKWGSSAVNHRVCIPFASIATILIFPPRFSFVIWGCARSSIKEWYPQLYNPIINHVKPLRCSYEVVFPLYSFPFVYLLFLLCTVLVFRTLLYTSILKRNKDAKAFYCALLALPKIAVIHALLAGVLYQSYPYIVMLWSLCANAVHLAIEGKVSVKEIAIMRGCSRVLVMLGAARQEAATHPPMTQSPTVNNEHPTEPPSLAVLEVALRRARPVFYGVCEEDEIFKRTEEVTTRMLEERGPAQ